MGLACSCVEKTARGGKACRALFAVGSKVLKGFASDLILHDRARIEAFGEIAPPFVWCVDSASTVFVIPGEGRWRAEEVYALKDEGYQVFHWDGSRLHSVCSLDELRKVYDYVS